MKNCTFCGSENPKEVYICETCGSFLGNEYTEPIASAKFKSGNFENPTLKKPTAKPVKKKKTDQGPAYVRLYHGPLVKRSTTRWLARKDKETLEWVLFWFAVIVVCGVISKCQ